MKVKVWQNMVAKANIFFNSYLEVIILIALIIGYIFSELVAPLSVLLSYLLMYMVFVMGTSCSLESIRGIASTPGGFILGLILSFLVMPLIGYTFGQIFYSENSDYAVGHLLLAIAPVAITSIIWTGFAGGNVTLALALVAVATLVSGFSIPFQVSIFMGQVVKFDAHALTLDLVKMIVLPVLFGILTRYKAPTFVQTTSPLLHLLSKLIMVVILMVNGAVVRPYISTFDWELVWMFLLVCLQLVLNFSSAMIITTIVLGRTSKDLSSVIFASSMRNSVAGIVIALNYFGPTAALPVLICILMQQMVAALFFRLLGKLNLKISDTR